MENTDLKSRLQILLNQINERDLALKNLEDAEHTLRMALEKKPTAAETFDSTYKNDYIVSKIGDEPQKPEGPFHQKVIISPKKRKEWKIAVDEYKKAYKSAEEDYYAEYEDRRNVAISEEIARLSNLIQKAESEKQLVAKDVKEKELIVSKNDLFGDRLKTAEALKQMIGFVQDHRADTLKDVVNLYYEEEHRNRLEEYAKEQLELTEEAKNYAEEAAENSREAIKRADDAYRRADEAYSRADDAMETARDAYSRASSSNNY